MVIPIGPDRDGPDRDGPNRGGPVERVYAIGDIHGRLDLFTRLIAAIRDDHAARGAATTRVVLLGDLIDRGPHSADLVRWCRTLAESSARFVVLKGNHEAMMGDALAGDLDVLGFWLDNGGRETLASWGVAAEAIEAGAGPSLLRAARRAVGAATLAWMAALPLMIRHEGFVLVHAGVRPGVALARQREKDLLWIRAAFLDSAEDHGAVVVHGHSVHEGGPDIRRNRINIDTGAYRTGRLTAIGIERAETWFLSADGPAAAGDAVARPMRS